MKKKVIYSLGLTMLVGGLIGEAQANDWESAMWERQMAAEKTDSVVRGAPSMAKARQNIVPDNSSLSGFNRITLGSTGATNAAEKKMNKSESVEDLERKIGSLRAEKNVVDKKLANFQSALRSAGYESVDAINADLKQAKQEKDALVKKDKIITSLVQGSNEEQTFLLSVLGKDVNGLEVHNDLCGGAPANFGALAYGELKAVFGDDALTRIQNMYQAFINKAKVCEDIARKCVYSNAIWGVDVNDPTAAVCAANSELDKVKKAEAAGFDGGGNVRSAVVDILFGKMKEKGLNKELDLSEDSWGVFQANFKSYVEANVAGGRGISAHRLVTQGNNNAAVAGGIQDADGVIRGEMAAILEMLQRYIRQDCLELSYCKMIEGMLSAIDAYNFRDSKDRDCLKCSLLQLVSNGSGLMAGRANIGTGEFNGKGGVFAKLEKDNFKPFDDGGDVASGDYLPAVNSTIQVAGHESRLASETKSKVVKQFVFSGNGMR